MSRRRVCFVCTGNICRSPMAEVVARSLGQDAGIDAQVAWDSAGTGGWHAGEGMDRRAAAALTRRGYDPGPHRARQWLPEWERDLVVVAAAEHPRALGPGGDAARLLTSWGPPGSPRDVFDPYYGADADFDACLELIEACCAGLVDELAVQLGVIR